MGDWGVVGSNPAAPTNDFKDLEEIGKRRKGAGRSGARRKNTIIFAAATAEIPTSSGGSPFSGLGFGPSRVLGRHALT